MNVFLTESHVMYECADELTVHVYGECGIIAIHRIKLLDGSSF